MEPHLPISRYWSLPLNEKRLRVLIQAPSPGEGPFLLFCLVCPSLRPSLRCPLAFAYPRSVHITMVLRISPWHFALLSSSPYLNRALLTWQLFTSFPILLPCHYLLTHRLLSISISCSLTLSLFTAQPRDGI